MILVCEMGGGLANKSGTKFGFQSRSLKAAWYLKRAGYRVSYVEGGLAQWLNAGLPLEGGADEGGPAGGEGSYEEAEEGVGGAVRGLLAGLKLPALSLPGRR